MMPRAMHDRIDARSLAFGRLIAARLSADPDLIGVARANLARWATKCGPQASPALTEWGEALRGPVGSVIEVLTGTDQRSVRLRQSNPFAGLLTPAERTAVIQQFRRHDAPAT
jgi:hypothetical protein